MEWLKKLLETAEIKDGKLDVDSLLKSINAEFPKHAVPKVDYNTKVAELKTATETIGTLKKENEDNETLQQKIKDYELDIKKLQGENESVKKTYALKEVLQKSGCADPDYLIFKHGGVDKFTFDTDGRPIGVDEAIKPYKDSNRILFPTGEQSSGYNPKGGEGNPAKNPFSKESFNLTEQGKLFRENPEQARAMAEAAGVRI